MSSKLAGRRVSMAPNRLRRPKRDPSGLADLDEDGSGRSGRLKSAIYNEEIASLRIRDEDLAKISLEVRATAAAEATSSLEPTSSRRVAVRREIPVALRRPPLRRFVLLRRAVPEDDTTDSAVEDDDIDAAVEATAAVADDSWWQPRVQPTPPGPRLDSRGNVVPHSLLGRPEDFYQMGLRRGHLRPEDLPPAYRRLAAASGDGWEAAEADVDGANRVLLLLSESGTDGDISNARVCKSAGIGVQHHWMPSRGFALPALENSEEAPVATNSAREHNRRVLAESGFQMRRLTEQLDQCQPASLSVTRHLSSAGGGRNSSLSAGATAFSTGLTGAAAAAAGCASAGQQRTAKLAGPLYSFIGGWSYQKVVLLG